MGKKEDLDKMKKELDAIVERNRKAFEGAHGDDLQKLHGLSQEDLNALIPNVADQAVYGQLIDVVKDASAKNLSAAQLKQRIEALGSLAVAIAKKAKLLGGVFS